MKTVVDETTLNWEWYLVPLMFSFNTSYHSTTKTTPFNLPYGMKPRIPAFPTEELQRISYGDGFVLERMQLLQQTRRMANQNNSEASKKYKEVHNKSASEGSLSALNESGPLENLFIFKKNKQRVVNFQN